MEEISKLNKSYNVLDFENWHLNIVYRTKKSIAWTQSGFSILNSLLRTRMRVEPGDVVFVGVCQQWGGEERLDSKIWPGGWVHPGEGWPQAAHDKVAVDGQPHTDGA